MKLNQLFKSAPEIEIEQLSTDSRLPMKNAIFFCLDGIKYDGHKFADEAIENGAKVIIYSKEITDKKNAIYIKVKSVNDTLYKVADIFYNHPNTGIDKYLISGCYGRSSVSYIINSYLNSIDSCGSVGIFGINYKDKHLDLNFPALTPLENLKVLFNFKNNGINHATFETSVISLYFKKLDVIKPEVFIYTNTSKYCSDYKVCNNSYFEYIRKYFYTLEDKTCVLFNADDEAFEELKESVNNYATYGKRIGCDYRFDNVELSNNKTKFNLYYKDETYEIKTKLLGLVNIYNLVAAIAGLNIRGHLISDVIKHLENINYVEGVMEKIDNEYDILIDCGYELDSIKTIIEYAKKTTKGKIIGIIGINYSDNDIRLKNLMQLCEDNLDVIILTEDESQQGEVMNILSKADKYSKSNKILHVSFRSIAIENAINIMKKDDKLLILGKGNEKFLTMGFGKERYSGDKHYAIKYLNKRKEEENEII